MTTKPLIPLLALTCALTLQAADPSPAAVTPPTTPPAPTLAAPVAPAPHTAPAPVMPGMEALTEAERAQYTELLKSLAENPEVKAAMDAARQHQEEARKLQQDAMKARQEAMTATRKAIAAREQAIKAAGPEAAALQAKVEAARQKWFEQQRAKYAAPKPAPNLPLPATPSAPAAPSSGAPVAAP